MKTTPTNKQTNKKVIRMVATYIWTQQNPAHSSPPLSPQRTLIGLIIFQPDKHSSD